MPTKYASQKVKDYVFAPGGFGLNWDDLEDLHQNPRCYLIALDDQQIAVILSLFKFLKFSWLWGFEPRSTWDSATTDKWDDISNFVAEMELCLMSGCDVNALLTEMTRIANAVEGIQQNTSTTTIQELLDDMGGPGGIDLEDLADLAEVLEFLKGILPGFPSLSLPLGDALQAFATWRFRQSMINLVEDIAVSERVQATAQFGTSGHSLYDSVGEHVDKLLLPAGFVGKAVWLWNRVKPTQIPIWASWVSDIAALILGNLRSALYDIRDNIDEHNTTQGYIAKAMNDQFDQE